MLCIMGTISTFLTGLAAHVTVTILASKRCYFEESFNKFHGDAPPC